jgi:hypothetical protein
MTTYSWPTTGVHPYLPSSMAWKQRHNTRGSTSSLNGASQTTSLPGMRWGVTLDFPQHRYSERAELEGFLSQLSGMEHRLSLWDLSRPNPSALGGSPLISGAVAQFASSINIAGTLRGGVNLLPASQSFDSAAWTKNGLLAPTADTVIAPDGTTTAEKLVPNTSAVSHLLQLSIGTFVAGETLTLSVYAKADPYGVIALQFGSGTVFSTGVDVRCDLTTGQIIAGSAGPAIARRCDPVAGSAGWYRVSVTAVTTGAGSFTVGNYISATTTFATAGDGVGGMDLWGMQLERASSPSAYTGIPALKSGDWLQVPTSTGNQLVMVTNAVAGETALNGVQIRPMLRGSVANNAAVVITRPPALFILAEPSLSITRGGGNICPPFSLDLIEVFA